jgi:hypothetical protein
MYIVMVRLILSKETLSLLNLTQQFMAVIAP